MTAAAFEAVLTAVSTTARRMHPCRWQFAVGTEPTVSASAQIVNDWIVLTTSSRRPVAGAIELLQQGAALPPGVKLTTADGHDKGGYRVECRLDAGVVHPHELTAAIDRLVRCALGQPTPPLPPAATDAPVSLAALCTNSGWPFAERSDGTIAIELAVEPSFQLAALQRGPIDGVVRLRTDLLITEGPPAPLCAQAAGSLLLRIADVVCLVRAVASPVDGGLRAGFEVAFATDPAPAEIHRACAALSIACRLGAAETDVLASDPDAAAAFLTFTHPGITQPEGDFDDDCYDCPTGH